MAESAGSIIIDLLFNPDELDKGIKKAIDGMRDLGQKITAFGVAGAAGFAITIKSAINQEEAINKLSVALRNQGSTSQKTLKDLVDYAAGLQKVTTFSDDSITTNSVGTADCVKVDAVTVALFVEAEILDSTAPACNE